MIPFPLIIFKLFFTITKYLIHLFIQSKRRLWRTKQACMSHRFLLKHRIGPTRPAWKSHHQLTENLIWNEGCWFFKKLKGRHQSAKPAASTKSESHKQRTLFHRQRIIAPLLSKQRNTAAKSPVQQWQTHRRQTPWQQIVTIEELSG